MTKLLVNVGQLGLGSNWFESSPGSQVGLVQLNLLLYSLLFSLKDDVILVDCFNKRSAADFMLLPNCSDHTFRVVDCHAGVLGSNPEGPKRFSPWNYFTGGSGKFGSA